MLSLILSMNSLFCLSQQKDYELVEDTFTYITFTIRSNYNYPVIMGGVCKNFIIDKFSKTNVNLFIRSFYKNTYYTPDIIFDVGVMLNGCIADKKIDSLLHVPSFSMDEMRFEIQNNFKESSFELASGEIVFLTISKMKGFFIKYKKTFHCIWQNSDEYNIANIPEINTCYLPLKVTNKKR